MNEFDLIDEVIAALGPQARSPWVVAGPGDDAAVIEQSPGCEAVASIDTLLADVHFPARAPGELIGYRAMMVAFSDLAAMAATPRFALVALTLPEADAGWAVALATGMAEAAREVEACICGGNVTRGALSITVSVHGEVPAGLALTRSGAVPGDGLYVSGDLGGAAACVRAADFEVGGTLRPAQQRYFKPRARVDLQSTLRAHAHAVIDLSDGLLQDLAHLARSSGVQARLVSKCVPVNRVATLQDALGGGDDYELLCASPVDLPGFTRVGSIAAGSGIYLDDHSVAAAGFDHFHA